MNLEALADFLEKRGLLLRSAFLNEHEGVSSFTCDPREPSGNTGALPVEEQSAPGDPDGLERFLDRKALRK